jgi:hypothetical protein
MYLINIQISTKTYIKYQVLLKKIKKEAAETAASEIQLSFIS